MILVSYLPNAALLSMYPESDELICEVPSLKVTIRLVLGWPKGQKCQETKNWNQWAPAPRDTVYVSPTLVNSDTPC